MFNRLASLVTRHWVWVLAVWLVLVAAVRIVAPRWDQVTHDGDFAYLPAEMTSVQGEKLLEAAFPEAHSKSQVAIVVSRPDGPLDEADFGVADCLVDQFTPRENDRGPVTAVWSYDSQVVGKKLISPTGSEGQAVLIVLRLRHEFAAVNNMRMMRSLYRSLDAVQLAEALRHSLDAQRTAQSELTAAAIAEELADRRALAKTIGTTQEEIRDYLRQYVAWFGGTARREIEPVERVLDKARRVLDGPACDELARTVLVSGSLGNAKTLGEADLSAKSLEAAQARAVETLELAHQAIEGVLAALRRVSIAEEHAPGEFPEDVLAALLGLEKRLDARLAASQPAGKPPVRTVAPIEIGSSPSGLRIGVTGSAAVGCDMLFAAKESIRNTELTTIFLVVLILLIVYRAPGLVVVPLVTIVASVSVAMGLIALATQLSGQVEWFDFKVFKTTKIFIIVILFGAGTDYCLFLISRYKEELARGLDHTAAIARSLGRVSDALAASALTTIFGLATMVFADFGKFRNSGPVIAFCLFVALLACLTLAPALLRGMGRAVFWPMAVRPDRGSGNGRKWDDRRALHAAAGASVFGWFWRRIASGVIARPGLILVGSVLVLAPLACGGFSVPITYDLLGELRSDCPSVRGTRLLEQHFLPSETGPVTVVAHDEQGGFDTAEGSHRIALLTAFLHGLQRFDQEGDLERDASGQPVDPIVTVRSLSQPLGSPPGSTVSAEGLSRMAVLKHPKTKAAFLARSPGYAGRVTRFDLILPSDPFSRESVDLVNYIERRLAAVADGSCGEWPEDQWPARLTPEQRADLAAGWRGVTFRYVGTTAGIRDLQTVTASDQTRIQTLVVIAVLGILIVILRRPLVCVYLILSVLLGYFVTIGITEWFFRWVHGATFDGLDWKVPIFLFVILIAVGQDYNIYLVTRVFEEQRRRGAREGLRVALVRTGGIITACGVIVAGTFASMGTGTLRAMQELGFALSLGVLLDTFVIRTILVPAFLALWIRRRTTEEEPILAEVVSSGPVPHLGKGRPGVAAEAEAARKAASG